MTDTSIKVGLIGDIFPADLPNSVGEGVASLFSRTNLEEWLVHVGRFTAGNDINFCNLESPLVLGSKETPYLPFAGHSDFTKLLRKCNIGVVSIANNHVLEQGTVGFFKTIKSLEANSIWPVGCLDRGFPSIVLQEIDGLRLAFAAFSAVHGKNQSPNTYAHYSRESVTSTIEHMKQLGADIIIISLHWGDEYCHIPHLDQTTAAKEFIDHGANVIVGHHPHVIQPVERYRKGMIIYSLGNFLFDMLWSDAVRMGMSVTLTISQDRQMDYQINPSWISDGFLPVPVNEKQATRFWKLLENNTNLMHTLRPDHELYNNQYERQRWRNRAYQRYKMKEYALLNFRNFSPELRRRILSNWWRRAVKIG